MHAAGLDEVRDVFGHDGCRMSLENVPGRYRTRSLRTSSVSIAAAPGHAAGGHEGNL
jgi:hypothetical protein